jgi:eukaryotic-like serine/threonine-protein kinase
MSARPKLHSDTHDLPSLPIEGDLVQGRYRVGAELGRGGMGVVLAARDVMLERDVALKVVLPGLMRSGEVVERFSNEARSLAKLQSPHVVKVHDFGFIAAPETSAGLPYMALELLRGEDLYSVATERGELSPSQVVSYVLQACAGLAEAHAHGIIHRDLKPENLFLAIEPDGSECLKVLDFGIARSQSRRVLTVGHGVGSPGYMSPEQIQGHGHVDARSDIWALGVVMYELLAQRAAFPGDNAQSVCLQVLTLPVEPLASLRPSLPPALIYIVERCMAAAPQDRFQDVAELAEALGPLVDAVPASDAERIRRRLDAADWAVVPPARLTPVQHLPDAEDRATLVVPKPRKRSYRRLLSLVLFAVLLVPVLALLPRVAQAPELAPARAWSGQALQSTQATWQRVETRARELWAKDSNEKPDPER